MRSGWPARAFHQRDDEVHRVELRQLVLGCVDGDMERVLEEGNQFEHAERVDDAAGEQGIVRPERAAAHGGVEARRQKCGHSLLQCHGDILARQVTPCGDQRVDGATHGGRISCFGSAPAFGTNFCVRPYWLSPPYKMPFESTVNVCTSRYPSGRSFGTIHV